MSPNLAYCKSAKWAHVRDYSFYDECTAKRSPVYVSRFRLRMEGKVLTERQVCSLLVRQAN